MLRLPPHLWPAALALALLLGVPALARAQICDTGAKDRVDLVVTPQAITYPTPTVVAFDRGWVQMLGSVTLDVRPAQPNKVWYLCFQSLSATQGGYGKPVADLEYSLDGQTWQPTTQTPARLASATGPQTVSVFFRMRLAWNRDVPGTYITDLAYTVAF